MAKEFHDAAPTLNLEELDNAWKCLGLGYLGMHESMWQSSAATLLRMETRVFMEREAALLALAQQPDEIKIKYRLARP